MTTQPAAPDSREAVAWQHRLFVDGECTLDVCDSSANPRFGIPGLDHSGEETVTPLYATPKPESETVALLRLRDRMLAEARGLDQSQGEYHYGKRVGIQYAAAMLDAALTTKEQKDLGRERDGSKS